MTIQQLWTPFKRELWEYRTGFFWVPATVALLLVLSVLYMAINGYVGGNIPQGAVNSPSDRVVIMKSQADLVEFNKDLTDGFMLFFVSAASILMWIPVAVVLMVYAHATLFDDRKNREILFWRSMPVSETQNVLTKLTTMMLVAPSILFVLDLMVVTTVILIEFFARLFGGQELAGGMSFLYGVGDAVKWYGIFLYLSVVLLPVFSWMLLSSALAKKSPFMVSSLIPIFLLVLDKIAFKVWGIDLHIVAVVDQYWALFRAVVPGEEIVLNAELAPSFLLVILFGGLMIAATIWLRNHRYEI